MWFEIVISLEEDRTGLLMHRNWSFHQNQVSPLSYIYIFDGKNFLSLSKHKVIFRDNYKMEQLLTK